MRNKLRIAFAILFFANTLTAQTMFYKDSSFTEPFTRLVNATPVSLGADSIWDDPTFTVPLGFNFRMFNDSTNTIFADGNFNAGAILTNKNILTSPIFTFFTPSFLDLVNRDSFKVVSPISYKTIGAAPDRVCILEWRNAGIYDELPTDSIDIQAWFYEGSDIFEFKYGNVNLQSPFANLYVNTNGTGDFVGMIDSISIAGASPSAKKSYFLGGDPLNPNFDSTAAFNLTGSFPGLDTTISSNQVYRFIPIKPIKVFPTAINIVDVNSKVSIQYFDATQIVQIKNAGDFALDIHVMDVNGAVINSLKKVNGNTSIDLSALPKAIYFVQIKNTNGMHQVYTISK